MLNQVVYQYLVMIQGGVAVAEHSLSLLGNSPSKLLVGLIRLSPHFPSQLTCFSLCQPRTRDLKPGPLNHTTFLCNLYWQS